MTKSILAVPSFVLVAAGATALSTPASAAVMTGVTKSSSSSLTVDSYGNLVIGGHGADTILSDIYGGANGELNLSSVNIGKCEITNNCKCGE